MSSCAGSTIKDIFDSRHSFYNYTSGRWMYNEAKRLSERHLHFNLHVLLNIIAKSVARPENDITEFSKIGEGGSYRVFEAKFEDGLAVIARLPYPCTIPPTYGIASEVATIEYLRLQGIPIPKVLDWSSSPATNPLGADLYFTDSLPHGTDMVVLPGNSTFCVGPSTEYLWWRLYGNKKVSPEVQIRNLEDFLSVAPHIIPSQEFLNEPTIRHPDFSPNNIFIDEAGEISGIIDWERTSILPLFVQAKMPRYFENYGDEDSENFKFPALREDFNSLPDDEKELEQEMYRRRQTHYYYLGFTSRYNLNHFRTMGSYSGMMRSRLYDVVNRPWEGDNTTLKATLIQMSSYWPGIAAAEMKDTQYPLKYSPEEVKQCLNLDAEQKTANTQMQNLRDAIGINVDGWVSREMYEEATERMAHIKAHMLEIAETEQDREDILQKWPFQDHEEID
ncbi:TPA_exp: Uncharacterized protein A8136_1783 [Trichophyton benhamiae CBS 112371]|nr:TPA_exp: Uncharacterized protein A8136_1783 [Trichophyton benhamiae CBS 112371]